MAFLVETFPTAALACGPVRRWSIPTSDPFFFCRERLKLCVSRLVKSLQSHWIDDTLDGMHGDKNCCWLPLIMSFWLLLNMDFYSLYTRPTPQLDLQLLRRETKPQSERHWLVHLFALDFTRFILYCLLVNVKTIKFKATFCYGHPVGHSKCCKTQLRSRSWGPEDAGTKFFVQFHPSKEGRRFQVLSASHKHEKEVWLIFSKLLQSSHTDSLPAWMHIHLQRRSFSFPASTLGESSLPPY